MKRPKRPVWAKKLTGVEWRHLQIGQGVAVPLLRNLAGDSATCLECKRILVKLNELGVGPPA